MSAFDPKRTFLGTSDGLIEEVMRTLLDEARITGLRLRYPTLPGEYLTYLSTVGWGEAPSGRMIYEAPVDPADIYPEMQSPGVVLLGDDLAGYCLCFNLLSEQYGELSPAGVWQPLVSSWSFGNYVREL